MLLIQSKSTLLRQTKNIDKQAEKFHDKYIIPCPKCVQTQQETKGGDFHASKESKESCKEKSSSKEDKDKSKEKKIVFDLF